MFDFFEGTLAAKTPARVVVACGGVGYELIIPLSTYQKMPDLHSAVHLLAHFHVTESGQQLFGFSDEKERALFRLLISISGVGPKVALSVLSGLGAEAFRQAVISGDADTIRSIPGVGRKTAERLIVELREKLVLDGGSVSKIPKNAPTHFVEIEKDSVSALLALGYKRTEVSEAIRKVFEQYDKAEDLQVEQVVRRSLKLL